jgi:hypothetical protein
MIGERICGVFMRYRSYRILSAVNVFKFCSIPCLDFIIVPQAKVLVRWKTKQDWKCLE